MAASTEHECAPCRYACVEEAEPDQYEIAMLEPGTGVEIPVWSAEDGQDDVYVYTAEVDDEGHVRCPLELTLHSASSPAQFRANDECIAEIECEVEGAVRQTPVQLELSRARREVYEEVGRDLHSVYLWTAENIDYTPRPWLERAPEGYTREQWFAFSRPGIRC